MSPTDIWNTSKRLRGWSSPWSRFINIQALSLSSTFINMRLSRPPVLFFLQQIKRQQKWKKLALRPKGIVSKVTGSPRKTDVIAFSCLELRDNKNQDSFGSWHRQTPLSSGFFLFRSTETYRVFHSDVKQSLVNVSNHRICPSVGVSSPSFTSSDFTYRMGSNSEWSPVLRGTHQDVVGLICGQHENRDVVVGQRCDDRFGDFGDSDGLRVGSVAAARHHVQGQPRGVGHADVLRLRQL